MIDAVPTGPAAIIRRTREAQCVSEADLARSCAMSVDSYWDLEHYDDEAFTAISLRQLKAICRKLRIPLSKLIAHSAYREQFVDGTLSVPAAIDPMAWRLAAGLSIEEVAEAIGYDNAAIGLIETDRESLGDFNVDMLADYANVLRVPLPLVLRVED